MVRFKEIFIKVIDQNRALANSQKLQYLVSALRGDAARLVRAFSISDENYSIAWQTLIHRYDNKRELAFRHIQKFLNLKFIKGDSDKALYEFLDICNEGVQNLSTLGLERNTLVDLILVYIIQSKLDNSLKKDWELHIDVQGYPSYEELITFLEKYARSLANLRLRETSKTSPKPNKVYSHATSVSRPNSHAACTPCMICKNTHLLSKCHLFQNKSLQERWRFVKDNGLCYNCLRSNHFVYACKLTAVCGVCKLKHHTLLHAFSSESHDSNSLPGPIHAVDSSNVNRVDSSGRSNVNSSARLNSVIQTHSINHSSSSSQILLSTALIWVNDLYGNSCMARALVDTGSQRTLITDSLRKTLNLPVNCSDASMYGIGDNCLEKPLGEVDITFSPHYSDMLFTAKALILNKITCNLPNFVMERSRWPHLVGLRLADHTFDKPAPINIIIGADIAPSLYTGQTNSDIPIFKIYVEEFNTYANQFDEICQQRNLRRLKLYHTNIAELFKTIKETYYQIVRSSAVETSETLFKEYIDVKNRYENFVFQIEEILEVENVSQPVKSEQSVIYNVKLPKFNLPVFSGEMSQWLSFKDLFLVTIDKNTTLSDIQKLQYLHSSLKGDAARIIKGFPITENNYKQAWKTLVERYDNKREIIFSQLDKIFKIKLYKISTSKAIYELLDICNESLRNLETIGLERNDMVDVMLIHFLQKKLDTPIRQQWELSYDNQEMPSYQRFISFLEKQAQSLMNTMKDTTSKENLNKRVNTYSINVGFKNCLLCKLKHKLNQCNEFRQMSIQNRIGYVKQNQLCFNCLRGNHSVENCKITNRCFHCNRNHHTLLHVISSPPRQRESSSVQSTSPKSVQPSSVPSTSTSCCLSGADGSIQILLSTAIIHIQDVNGEDQICRALLDNGSQRSLITERCAAKLGIPIRRKRIAVGGLGDQIVESSLDLPLLLRGKGEVMELNRKESGVNVLGIQWDPSYDTLNISCKSGPADIKSKRQIVSAIARIYDPCGWLSPTTVVLILLLQELWKLKIGWDEDIPASIQRKWNTFEREMKHFQQISIPRCIFQRNLLISNMQMHGFCDSSELAYSAVCYLRITYENNQIETILLTAKTKVAPIKKITIPRLELCAALMLAQLQSQTTQALPFNIDEQFYWTDSKIVLAWITSESKKWQIFVANRVAKIQDLTAAHSWQYISGKQNPADLATRGILPSCLINSKLWWHGPVWLTLDGSENIPSFTIDPSMGLEERSVILHATIAEPCPEFFSKYSSFTKLSRVMAWCKRFINIARKQPTQRLSFLTSQDLKDSLLQIVKIIQRCEFTPEINACIKNIPLPRKSKLISLNIFIDSQGILRVGGRLRHSDLDIDQKHPMLIPKDHFVTKLIVLHYHLNNLHSGTQLTLSLILNKFWIPSGRNLIKRVLNQCLVCLKSKSKAIHQIMGDLPKNRLLPGRPFEKIGIDLAGPIQAKPMLKRSKVIFKFYIVLFVCFTTKAIHLEISSDLTAETFLAALKRFISRRGRPTDIYSDNATNFKGASNILKERWKLFKAANIQDFSAIESINWHFIPPSAPNFGGLWEAGIKSVKTILSKTMKSRLLNYEELLTLLAQIEACLNSRPLTFVSNDPNDLTALTPGHFLIGNAMRHDAESDHSTLNLRSRWDLIQPQRDYFWNRWSCEYLHQLQERRKWRTSHPDVNIGDLVMLKEQNKPLQWKLARIVQIFPGEDDHVRVVLLRTPKGLLKRPITKICPLPYK
ncbi:hypothetical protein LAZ67_X001786, partial [Cordylochernes scorpioides]